MFAVIPVNVKGVLAFKATGKLSDEDYQTFLPLLEEEIRKSGRISLYVELEDFEGWEPKGVWDDMRFGFQHDRDFKRIAIVGDKTWEHAGITVADLFTQTNMRFFSRDEADIAWAWLEQADDNEHPMSAPSGYRQLLLGTDFSSHSEPAAQRARQLAEATGAELEILHVVEDMLLYADEADPILADLALNEKAYMENAERNMRVFVEKLGFDAQVKQKLLWGNPKWSIVSRAREIDADLIVMGSHGRRGIARLLGSVSHTVLNRAPCDVLVVRA